MRKKKIKILHVAQAAGGVDRYIRMLLKYLDKEKFENILVCSQDFNREDVQGTNYLAEDCNRLISFFDARSGRPGADNLFEDLFVSVSEQEDDPAQPTLFELLYQQMDKEPQKAESGGSSKSLDQDEKFSSMHIRAAFIIASEAIYSPSAEYKRVPDKIINKAKQWSEQYPKKIEFQEAYFGLLFSRLKYAQAQDMRNEQRRVYREMKTVAERANYSEYNESNQLMESVDILHRVFGY